MLRAVVARTASGLSRSATGGAGEIDASFGPGTGAAGEPEPSACGGAPSPTLPPARPGSAALLEAGAVTAGCGAVGRRRGVRPCLRLRTATPGDGDDQGKGCMLHRGLRRERHGAGARAGRPLRMMPAILAD